jgi:hypothetical protein
MDARWLAAAVLGAFVLASCGASTPSPSGLPAASANGAGSSPGCPDLSAWPPYDDATAPAGVTVTALGSTAVSVANSTSRAWTAHGELWQWMPCFGLVPTTGETVSVPAGSSVEVSVPRWQDFGGGSETTPVRAAVALYDHACTAETCED